MAWLASALDAAIHGVVGSEFGIPFDGLRLGADAPWLVTAEPVATGPLSQLGAGAALAVALSGTLAVVALALSFHYLLGRFRAGGVARALALQGAVLALLWGPSALVAAALPGGGGPVGELYLRLGSPQAGRWAALPLGLLVLVLLAGVTARRAVAVGRAWMRVDAPEFRRRLVSVVAGYPGAAATAATMIATGWTAPVWAVFWAFVILVTLRLRTA